MKVKRPFLDLPAQRRLKLPGGLALTRRPRRLGGAVEEKLFKQDQARSARRLNRLKEQPRAALRVGFQLIHAADEKSTSLERLGADGAKLPLRRKRREV